MGSCWWGVKRLSLALSLSSVSWRRESRTAAAAAATAPPARRSWSWWRCGAAGSGGGSDRPPAAGGGGGDGQAGGWPLVVETAGGLELLAAPRSVSLGPAATNLFSTTPVRDCQPVSTGPGERLPGVAGPSPTPFVYVPGPTRKPRALLCVCCVKVTAELDLSPFFAPGDFPGKGLWGKLWKGKTWLAGGTPVGRAVCGIGPGEGRRCGRKAATFHRAQAAA